MTPSLSDLSSAELRPHLIAAMLPHVSFDGWGEKALLAAASDLGVDGVRARLAFPEGLGDMLAAYLAKADADLEAALAERGLHNMKVRERITLAVRTRLELAIPHREAARRAASLLLLPQFAGLAARSLWATADTMWRAAGDTSTDFNFYSKRTILSGVYSATLLVWLADESEEFATTWAFLDRRIADVMKIEKAKAQWRKSSENLPSLTRFWGKLRYPAPPTPL
jgi:ubiquinone biosynthesis protein COQ9